MNHFVDMVLSWTPEPVESLRRHILLERVATGAELSWKLKRIVRIDEVDSLREKGE